MTDAQLTEWEALAKAADPGPWGAFLINGNSHVSLVRLRDGDDKPTPLVPGWDAAAPPNARFIVAARMAVPDLIAEVRRLRALSADLAAEINCGECRKGEHEHRGNGNDCAKWRYEQSAPPKDPDAP